MDLKHVKNLDTNTPVMLLHGEIGEGYDMDGLPMLSGVGFANEILWLQYNGYKQVLVSINSPGGSLRSAYSIFSSILLARSLGMYVITQNDGVAASCAFDIMQAGDKRVMRDYGIMLYHEAYYPEGSNPNADDMAMLEYFNNSVAVIMASRIKKSVSQVREMMRTETRLNPKEALKAGFIDEIILTNDESLVGVDNQVMNVSLKDALNICNLIYNKNNMENIIEDKEPTWLNKVLEALNMLKPKNEATETEIKPDFEAEKAALNAKNEQLVKEFEALKAENEALKASKEGDKEKENSEKLEVETLKSQMAEVSNKLKELQGDKSPAKGTEAKNLFDGEPKTDRDKFKNFLTNGN